MHVVDGEVIEALGPDGYLINIARGSVVDEQALVAALLAGGPAGGSGTHETRAAMAELTLANLAQFAADGTLVTPVF